MSYHTAIILNEKGIMLIFGGSTNYQGVVYSLDLTDMKWSVINDVVYKRAGQSANLIEDSVYLFGGLDINWDEKNDLHRFDIKK